VSDSNLQQSIKVRDTISRMSFYDNTLPFSTAQQRRTWNDPSRCTN